MTQPEALLLLSTPPTRQHRRTGVVRTEGHVFTDDGGEWLAVGASLFWAGWGYLYDRERLEQNLAWLQAHQVDYIRVIGVVGPTAWSDRTFSPSDPGYDVAIAGLTDLAYDKYGMRVEWTIFGGTETTPTPADRLAVVDRFLAMSRGREHKIQFWEICNEAFQNFS